MSERQAFEGAIWRSVWLGFCWGRLPAVPHVQAAGSERLFLVLHLTLDEVFGLDHRA